MTRAQEALLLPEDIERRASAPGLGGWHELAAFLRQYLDVLDQAGEVDFAGLVAQAAAAASLRRPALRPRPRRRLPGRDLRRRDAPGRAPAGHPRGRRQPRAHVFSFQGRPTSRFGASPSGTPVRRRSQLATGTAPRPRRRRGVARAARLRGARGRRARAPPAPRARSRSLARPRRRRATCRMRTPKGFGVRSMTPASLAWPRSRDRRRPSRRPGRSSSRWSGSSRRTTFATRLVEPLLTSELGRLSPASARSLLRLVRAHGRRPSEVLRAPEHAGDDDRDAIAELDADPPASRGGSPIGARRVRGPVALASVRAGSRRARRSPTPRARLDLDAVVEFSRAVSEAGRDGRRLGRGVPRPRSPPPRAGRSSRPAAATARTRSTCSPRTPRSGASSTP